MKSSPTGVSASPAAGDHLLRRGAVGAGQAGAVDGVDGGALVRAANCSTTVAPAAVVPPLPNSAPSSFSSISAKKLSE